MRPNEQFNQNVNAFSVTIKLVCVNNLKRDDASQSEDKDTSM